MSKSRANEPSQEELSTRFKKGKAKTGGRKKGALNRNTMMSEVRSAMEAGMEVSGGKDGKVGYLRWLAREHPRHFALLLEKML